MSATTPPVVVEFGRDEALVVAAAMKDLLRNDDSLDSGPERRIEGIGSAAVAARAGGTS